MAKAKKVSDHNPRKPRQRVDQLVKDGAIKRVQEGQSRAEVAKEIGVSLATINNWMASAGGTSGRGRRGKSVVTEFADAQDNSRLIESLRLENAMLRKLVQIEDPVERLKAELDYTKRRLALYEK